ncbi:glutamyl-tRNA amidotransferase [Opitutaceae bacterium EW11]|nr:glutamyl-tRNA amidotransferase [Opitutaceae bacterium EW11]
MLIHRTLSRGLRLAAAAVLLSAARLAAAEVPFTTATIADLDQAFAAGSLTSEQLTRLCLARIEAFDKKGPGLNAVITLNPKALEEARALDAERKAKGPRSPLHGIPVVLKDNFDTADLPTTGGFFGLKGSLPPQDATVVARLRAAGAIILAKVNLSEFASGGAMSSLGGQSHNPHALDRTPSGSSGGTGVAIAAAYAPLGYGTDTGGSIRGPSTSNGIVGLKPTHGLLSRAGIIPLALSFDTGGPMARSVYDIAVSLNVTAGAADPRDDATKKSEGKVAGDYTRFLDAGALKGARIGVARDFMGQDPEVDSVIESALSALKAQGATLVDIKYPAALHAVRTELYNAIRRPEFKNQIQDYLATLKPGYPKTHADILALSEKVASPTAEGFVPNHGRLALYRLEARTGSLTDPAYLAARDHGLAYVRESLQAIFDTNKLDAIVYPTSPKRPQKIGEEPNAALASGTGAPPSPTNFANLSGFPDLIVPAGFTTNGLPVGISFFGTAFSEPKLLALGYAFEQATHALRTPVNAPALPGETITY